MKTKLILGIVALTMLSGLAGYALNKFETKQTALFKTADKTPAYIQTGYTAESPGTGFDFQKAADMSVASVVHIKTVTKVNNISRRQQGQASPFGDDFFRQFFGQGVPMPTPDQRASGSGVIISSDGYIVTNNHVVDGASEITVTLNDRKNYSAKVVGTDPNTDLALVKIDAKNLPVMTIGNSDDVHLGQWVLAIGYPLDLDVTVTQGIVSALSRSIGINRQGKAPVESFIQTDAAVNPGSSGGALVNTNGELVGINAAIASPTGSYAGYAYAIPANLMKKVISDIREFGKVQRGYLGISMMPEGLDDAKKKELGVDDDIAGSWVMDIDPNGAAAAAGLQKSDVITAIDGKPVTSNSALSEMVATHKPGDQIEITYQRNGQERTTTATLKSQLGTFGAAKDAVLDRMGAQFENLDKEDAQSLGLSGGVRVVKIGEGVLYEQTNMEPGFIITKVGDVSVKTVDELKDALTKQDGNFQLQGRYPNSNETYYYGINDFNK